MVKVIVFSLVASCMAFANSKAHLEDAITHLEQAQTKLDRMQNQLNKTQQKVDAARYAIEAAMYGTSEAWECRHSVPTDHTRSIVGEGDSEQAARADYLRKCIAVDHWSVTPYLCEIHSKNYMTCFQATP